MKNAILIISLITLFWTPTFTASANTTPDLKTFKAIPVLHQGRAMPMDTLARTTLKQIYTRDSFENQSASAWLHDAIYAPKKSIHKKLFRINHPDTKTLLKLPVDTKYVSAFELSQTFETHSPDIESLLKTPIETLSLAQTELLHLYENTLTFTLLLEGTSIQYAQNANPLRIKTEILYNTINPLQKSILLYSLALLLGLTALQTTLQNKDTKQSTNLKRASTNSKRELYHVKYNTLFSRLTILTTAAATLLHITAIAARIYILDRPPVGTLYESVIFVALICILITAMLYIKHKQIILLNIGTLTATLLLLIAPLSSPTGESMDTLAAVLNTNFWLATHVLCITIGYGVCVITACLAHIALLKPKIKLDKLILSLSIIALFFTTIGTILGGIWADQSWGRFWGWDPKENGALLIVLWLIWAHHGKIANKLSTHAFHATLAFLNVIVALAWFGVNLLNVGLHSYGFTTGMATGLATFCTLQTGLIAILWINATKKKAATP